MKNALAALLVGSAIVGTAFSAFAGEGQGVIAAVDVETRTIMLEDGSSWVAADGLEIEGLATGDTVAVVYDDGTTTLTAIEKVQ